MDKPADKPAWLLNAVITAVLLCFIALLGIPNGVRDPWTSPANACINNLRRIDAAKEAWALQHNAKTNDIVTIDDIRPYLEQDLDPRGKPYITLDANGNLPRCPSGGVYTIGKIGDFPTCSIGTNAIQPHVME
jgi:hypothetical protein